MLAKRRHHGVSLSPLLACLLTAALFLYAYQLATCPPPAPARPFAPSYLLLLPGNASALPPPYPLGRLPTGDAAALIDVRGFHFTINNFPCNASAPLLLVLVHSAPWNVDKRRVIRDTWGRERDGVRLLFLLGAVDTPELQARLDDENRLHQDLVQGSFKDSYRNMTYKHVMALKWTSYYCPGAKYLLKTDDDVFVNSPALVDFLSQELSPWGARRLILCVPFQFAYVKRSFRSKWRVSPNEYPGKMYPSYCAGWAIIYSPDVVFMLYSEAQRARYFWIDDVHITGTLASRVNLTQTPLGSLVLTDQQVHALNKGDDGSAFLFGPPNLASEHIVALWRLVEERVSPLTPS